MASLSQKFQTYEQKMFFYWKNKVITQKHDFTIDISEKDFIDTYLKGGIEQYNKFKVWEHTEGYANIKKFYYSTITEQDFIKMYESVREKALQGDNPSIKTFMMLQKEIDKINKKKNKNKIDDEDDGLVI